VSNITSYEWSVEDNYEHTYDPPKLFLIIKNMRAMRWMAMWQEQEDGVVKNFSIITVAKDW
jgi:hypothetical protein